MQINLKNSAATLTLCHGYDYAGQPGYWIGPLGQRTRECEWTVRIGRPIRGTHEIPFANELLAATYTFEVYQECATQAAAAALLDTLPDTLPAGETTLEIIHPATTITYAPAILHKLHLTQHGLSITAHYTFRVTAATPQEIAP